MLPFLDFEEAVVDAALIFPFVAGKESGLRGDETIREDLDETS